MLCTWTVYWLSLATAGRAPGRQQAEALRGVQVVFCAGGPADEGGRQQQQQGSDSSRDPGGGSPAEQPRHSLRGRRSTPAGAKAFQQRRSSTPAAASGGVQRSEPGDKAAGAGPAPASADSSNATGGAGHATVAGHTADAAPAGGVEMAGAVQLAEALSEGRSQGEPLVAVGTLSMAQGGESSARLMQRPSLMHFWPLPWVQWCCNSKQRGMPQLAAYASVDLCNMALSTRQPHTNACQARFSACYRLCRRVHQSSIHSWDDTWPLPQVPMWPSCKLTAESRRGAMWPWAGHSTGCTRGTASCWRRRRWLPRRRSTSASQARRYYRRRWGICISCTVHLHYRAEQLGYL